ncbi:hypothetical protein DFJ73DRAFT_823094 [Zopfochytrium polystomum]|nr:hypothetical protein DFJ73DRAFT_823094 [Zopfochytrium polystomum]
MDVPSCPDQPIPAMRYWANSLLIKTQIRTHNNDGEDATNETHRMVDDVCASIRHQLAAWRDQLSSSGEEATDEELSALDALGVALWNEAVERQSSARLTLPSDTITASNSLQSVTPLCIAQLRDVAFDLLLAGTPSPFDEKCKVKLMDLSVKAGKAWYEAREFEKAEGMYQKAMSFTDGILDHDTGIKRLYGLVSIYQAQLVWDSSRSGVSFHLANRIVDPNYASFLTYKDMENVSHICIECSQSCEHSADSIQWLKIALSCLETWGLKTPSISPIQNKVTLLLGEALAKAGRVDAALPIIEPLLTASERHVALTAFKLKIEYMAKLGFSDVGALESVVQSFSSNISMSNATQEELDIFFAALFAISNISVKLALSAANSLVQQTANSRNSAKIVESVAMTKIQLLASKDAASVDSDRLTEVKKIVAECIAKDFSHDTARLVQIAVWRAGERAFQERRFKESLDWFQIGIQLFTGKKEDTRNVSILRRKQALANIELGLWEKAEQACDRVDEDEPLSASTAYLRFIIALNKDDQDAAIKHLAAIGGSSEAESTRSLALSLLLSAADRAFKMGKKKVLMGVFKKIVASTSDLFSENVAFWRRALLIIIRCILKLSKSNNPSSSLSEKETLQYIKTGCKLLQSWSTDLTERNDDFEAEATWFHRTVWNMALEKASTAANLASSLFGLCHEILKLLEANAPNLTSRKICLFLQAAGEIELARSGVDCLQHLDVATTAIKDLKKAIEDLKPLDTGTNEKDLIALQMIGFEYEAILLRHQADPDSDSYVVAESTKQILDSAVLMDAPIQVFQRLADLSMRLQSPSSVVFMTVRAALEAELRANRQLDLKHFSHWFRVLVRSSQVSTKNISLFQQAIGVIKANGVPTTYPPEEIQWLMITAWNCGCEYFRY